ncbi:hypothetical protein RFI_19736, partial [Reticulomyxa filosa]
MGVGKSKRTTVQMEMEALVHGLMQDAHTDKNTETNLESAMMIDSQIELPRDPRINLVMRFGLKFKRPEFVTNIVLSQDSDNEVDVKLYEKKFECVPILELLGFSSHCLWQELSHDVQDYIKSMIQS